MTGLTKGRYHPFISSVTVPSVLGPVDGDALGFVLPHEHLTIDNRAHHAPRPGLPPDARVGVDTLGEVRVWPRALADNIVLDDDIAVLADLRAYLAAGGRTLVEVTPIGMGRDLTRLRGFAQASGVHVIASTAYYVQRGHGDRVAGRTAEHIAAEFIHDLTQGTPRCGMIGEIGISAEPHPDELTVLQAALLAQEATGAPITIHVTTIRPVPALLDFLERSGRPLDRVVLGHMDYDLRTLEPHRRALGLGLTVELDLFGYPAWTNANFLHFPTDSQRISALVQLTSEGFADQLLMSHDVCQKMQLTSRGGFGYAHIPAHVAALFLGAGRAARPVPPPGRDDTEAATVLGPRRVNLRTMATQVEQASGRPASELSPSEQKTYYEDQGYLVFPQLLSGEELAHLRAALAEVLPEADGLTESTDKFSVTQSDDGTWSVRRIFNPIAHHQAFADLILNPNILDVVENLIGPNIQLHHTKLNLKPPSNRQARFEWHQDYPFFPHTNFDLLAVMIYLDDSTEENGCLTIVPGSHKLGPRNHMFAKDGAFSSQLEDKTVLDDPTGWLKVPVPAGGMELHHCNMLHSSTANRGTKPRSAFVIQYRAADNAQIGGSVGHFGHGMQVRGANPYIARMMAGTFKLPGKIEDPLQRDG